MTTPSMIILRFIWLAWLLESTQWLLGMKSQSVIAITSTSPE
jgi:hypothetical protein